MKYIREYVNPEIKDVIFLYSYKILDVGVKEVYIGCIRENTPYHNYCFIPNDKKYRLDSSELRSIALKIEHLERTK